MAVKMRYIGGGDVILVRHNGDQVDLKDGDEIAMTEEEARGCACKPERADGIWERGAIVRMARAGDPVSKGADAAPRTGE